GPVGGGRLSTPTQLTDELIGELTGDVGCLSSELALKFVLSNPNVDIAFSGMTKVEMIEENVEIASREEKLTEDEISRMCSMLEKKKELVGIYCTGCLYCMPCPEGVNIHDIFNYNNWYKVYQIEKSATKFYRLAIERKNDASRCVECGQCEEKCPQKLKIIQLLKETHQLLTSD
ncbi:MAG: 4Fe-4S dicluster domain-containing protein, partial [Desulfatiglandales bacterium]|nr:4Fe-4S dicluster domain-containing protein [Desulfatiglandales bacterium]